MKKFFVLCIALGASIAQASPDVAKPIAAKYPEGRATPFSKTSSLGLSPATLGDGTPFWGIMPFHNLQKTGASCSTASATMALNALRGSATLTKDDELFTEESLLKCTRNKDWALRVGISSLRGARGTPLSLFSGYLKQALTGCLPKQKFNVEVFRPAADGQGLNEFKKALSDFQAAKGAQQIIANFDQGVVFQDATVGHLSPIAAYDAKTDRALILDTDKKWYEPYWVSVPVLWEAMRTKDSEQDQLRGYLRITQLP